MQDQTFQTPWQKAKRFLQAQQTQSCWPYFPSHGPSVEATCWSIIALQNEVELVQPAIAWLIKSQNDDGGWSTAPNAGPSDWSTALGLLALRLVNRSDKATSGQTSGQTAAIQAAIKWLNDHVIDLYTPLGKVVYFFLKGEASYNYPRGWPWTPGTFHWVEPTSYVLIALKPLPQVTEEPLRTLIRRANEYLLAYSCLSGGWNYGEVSRLNEKLPAYQMSTAEALVALQDMQKQEKVQSGCSFLQQTDNNGTAPLTLAWTILAKDIYGSNIDADLRRLISLQRPDGSFDRNIFTTAVAACAIACKTSNNSLKFPK